jgi:hypothetical protein
MKLGFVLLPALTICAAQLPAWNDPFWPSWGLVIVGAVTARIAIRTLNDLKEQTVAVKISADAAKKSAELAEASLKLVERADILLEAVSLIDGQTLGGKDARVVLKFKNFGRSIAQDVQLKFNLVADGLPESNCERIPPISMGTGESKTISSQRFVEFMTEPLARQIFSGEIAFKFEAEARYKDIFENQRRSIYTGTWEMTTNMFQINKQQTE